MKNVIRLCAVLCVLQVSSVAIGASGTWTNWQANQDWFDAGNWNSLTVPGAGEDAFFNVAGPLPAANVGAVGTVGRVILDTAGAVHIQAGGDLTNQGQAFIGNNSAGSLVANNGGTFSVSAEFLVGANNASAGSLTVNTGGTVNANGAWLSFGFNAGSSGLGLVDGGMLNANLIYVGFQGDGDLTIDNGGAVNVAGNILLGFNNPAATGDVIIKDGTLTASGVNIGAVGTGSLLIEDAGHLVNTGGYAEGAGGHTVTINDGGIFEFQNSPLADVQNLVNGNPNWIFSGTPSITGSLGSVIVTNSAIPEPTSLVLLGLGICLTVCRRQRRA